MNVPFTMLANLAWNPACSVPAGVASDGMPVGLQIMGRRHDDHTVLRLARLLEQVQPWPRHAPDFRGARTSDARWELPGSVLVAEEALDFFDEPWRVLCKQPRFVGIEPFLELAHVVRGLLVVIDELTHFELVGLGRVA